MVDSTTRRPSAQERTVTPQNRTGVSLLTSTPFDPDVWVVVDGGHPDPLDAVGSGAGVIVLHRSSGETMGAQGRYTVDWQYLGCSLPNCTNSTDAELWAAARGLEQVAESAGKKNICLVSDSSAVAALHRKLLVIELEAKYAERYAKEMSIPPLKYLADLYLRSQPCQIISRQTLSPTGFNVILLAAHQAAHELATEAAYDCRQTAGQEETTYAEATST